MSQSGDRVVRAGFIGVGNFVAGNHLPNIAASKLWQVAAVCDLDEAARGRAVERYAPLYETADYRRLLADPGIDAIVLGVQHQHHLPFIREIAAAGKHMLVEKPMTVDDAESRQVVEAVRAANVKLMVGFNRRFAPLAVEAKRVFHQRNRGKQALITYRAVDDRFFWPDYAFDPKRGGGKIMCECCHFFDFLHWFLEAEPVRVFCEGYREDQNVVSLRFDDGSIGSIISGGNGSVAFPKERMEVFCDRTTMVLDQMLWMQLEGYEDAGDRVGSWEKDPFPNVGTDGTPHERHRAKLGHWLKHGIQPEDFARKAYYGSFPKADLGHFAEIEAFARAILADTPSPCDEVAGARATACSTAAIRSMEAGYVPVAVRREEYLPG